MRESARAMALLIDDVSQFMYYYVIRAWQILPLRAPRPVSVWTCLSHVLNIDTKTPANTAISFRFDKCHWGAKRNARPISGHECAIIAGLLDKDLACAAGAHNGGFARAEWP